MAETPALSPSIAQVLLEESPLHAWTIHRLLGNRPRPSTDAQEKGRMIHSLLLDGGRGIEVIDADDFRTKAAKEARDAARARGKTPVTRPKFEAASEVAQTLRERIYEHAKHPRLERLADWDRGLREVRMEWHEMGRAGQVLCHGHLDWLSPDRQLIVDIKTTEGNAHPDICAAMTARSHSALQVAAYPRSVTVPQPELAGRVDVLFLFCELTDPWVVTPAFAAGSMKELGAIRWQRAVDIWSDCLATDRWPAYCDGPAYLEAPAWAVSREITMEEMGA